MQNFSRNIWKRFFIFAEKFLQNILQKYFRIFVLQSFTEYFFYKTFFPNFFCIGCKSFLSEI